MFPCVLAQCPPWTLKRVVISILLILRPLSLTLVYYQWCLEIHDSVTLRFPKMGVPPNHPFLDGIFLTNHLYWCTTHFRKPSRAVDMSSEVMWLYRISGGVHTAMVIGLAGNQTWQGILDLWMISKIAKVWLPEAVWYEHDIAILDLRSTNRRHHIMASICGFACQHHSCDDHKPPFIPRVPWINSSSIHRDARHGGTSLASFGELTSEKVPI